MDVRLQPARADVTQTLTLTNHVNMARGPYVVGARHPGLLTELLSMSVPAGAQLSSFQQDGRDAAVTLSGAGDDSRRLTTVLRLPAGSTTTIRVRYRLAVRDHRYALLLVPQPLAHDAQLSLRIQAHDATLGVVSGMHQPREGVATLSGAWTSVHEITVPVHPLRGLTALAHAFAHFWTHKISL
jgi:hypothetical protein